MSFTLSLTQLKSILAPLLLSVSSDDLGRTATGLTTDTRTLKPGEIFVALRGEHFDGHDFLETAMTKGAIALIVDTPISENRSSTIPQFQVKDTLSAYQSITHWWRNCFEIPVIGITGSVGKTSTKELISAVLSTQGKVLKTQANYNNEIGVPKTLLGITAEHDYAVIEMAMRAKGEIALLTQIAHPTIGVITNVGTAHIGRLGSEAAIAQAKCELLAEMSDSAVAILNQDSKRLMETAARVWQGKTITYGLEGGEVRGEVIDGTILRIEGLDLPLPLAGRHHAINYLAALAVAKALGIKWDIFQSGLTVELPGARSRRYTLPNDIVLLDETYNAGLESMLAALHLLKETPGSRHIAVLGTMKELGERSPQFHYQVGETVKNLNLDYLLVLVDDPETWEMAEGATGIPSQCFTDHDELVQRLKAVVQAGDRILFKASNSVGLTQVVEKFRAELAYSH